MSKSFGISGTALGTKPLKSAQDTRKGASLPTCSIDLFNFDHPGYGDSKYVLTSPRSLEACVRIGVKPCELLHKTLECFQQEHKSCQSQKVLQLYKQYEANRKEKLNQARLERARLSMTDISDANAAYSNDLGQKRGQMPAPNRSVSFERFQSDREMLSKNIGLPHNEKKRLALLAQKHEAALRLEERQHSIVRRRYPAKSVGPHARAKSQPGGGYNSDSDEDLPPQLQLGDLDLTAIQADVELRARHEVEAMLRRAQSVCDQERRWEEKKSRDDKMIRLGSGLELLRLEEDAGLRKSLDLRDLAVENNQARLQSCRQKMAQSHKCEHERRLRSTRERRQLLEAEVGEYRHTLDQFRDQNTMKAEERVSQRMQREKQRIHDDRLLRERQRGGNIRMLQQEEEDWRHDAEEMLRSKEERARMALAEKESKVLEGRALAEAAEQLRGEIRRTYQLDSFDKRAQHAILLNQMGLGDSAAAAS